METKDLQMIPYAIINRDFNDVPRCLRSRILEMFFSTNEFVYVDSNNHIIDIPQKKDYEDMPGLVCTECGRTDPLNSDDMLDFNTFVYPGEKQPDPIYRIIINTQLFCILCDASDPAITVGNHTRNLYPDDNLIIEMRYCSNICSKIGERRLRCMIRACCGIKKSFWKSRYAKNHIEALYSDSNFRMLNMDIIRYIMSKYLDVIGLT